MNPESEDRTRLAVPADYDALATLYLEYKGELATFGPDVDIAAPLQRDWFERPEQLFAYVFEHNAELVGFAFVLGPEYSQAIGETSEFFLYELYVLPNRRGDGTAENGVRHVFEQRDMVKSCG